MSIGYLGQVQQQALRQTLSTQQIQYIKLLQMNSIELNYGADRATVKYGVFNAEYPKPNRRREFILDIDTFCQQPLAPQALAGKLDDFHRAACSVFETAVTDALRRRMGAR